MLNNYEYRYRITGEEFTAPIQCNNTNSVDNEDGTITVFNIPDDNIAVGNFQVRVKAIDGNPPSNWLISGSSFTKSLPPEQFGVIYSKNNFTDPNEFNVNNTTITTESGKLIAEPLEVGTFNSYIDIPYGGTILENFEFSIIFKMISEPTLDSYGIGISRTSTNTFGRGSILSRYSVNYTVDGEDKQKLIINIQNGDETWQELDKSERLISDNTDEFKITISRQKNTITSSIYNITKSTQVSCIVEYEMGNTPFPYLPNTGKYRINLFGGTFEISEITLSSLDYRNADIMVCGDSKTQGYNVSDIELGFCNLLREDGFAVFNAGGGWDRTSDGLSRIEEMKLFKPTIFINHLGSNDKRTGVPFNTWAANHKSISDQMEANGSKVYIMKMFNESSINFEDYNSWIDENYPSYRIINVPTLSLAPDGVHPNDVDQLVIKQAILNTIYI